MPISLTTNAPTLFIRREAFERSGITRQSIDEWLNLTADEFQVEGALIAIGPIYDDDGLQALIAELEDKGLAYFDDFFEMSGNWPEWVRFVALAGGKS